MLRAGAVHGQPEIAWQAIVADERRLRESGLLKVSGIRLENAWLRGRVGLALAEKAENAARSPWLAVVGRDSKVLRKGEHQTEVAMGAPLEAGMRWLAPRADRASLQVRCGEVAFVRLRSVGRVTVLATICRTSL